MYINAPTMAEPSMAIIFQRFNSLQFLMSRRRTRCEMVQKRNRMVAADSNALIMFTIRATCEGSLVNCEKRLAVSMKKGAPGG